MPSAGSIDCRFKFQSRTSQPDGYGNFQGDWQTQFTVWASRMFIKGGEQVMADRLSGRQPGVITVRMTPDTRQVTTDWRVVNDQDKEEIWNVRSVQFGQHRDEIEFLCERGMAHG